MRVSLYEVCWNDWCTEAEGFDEYRDHYLARMGVPHAVYVDVTSIVCRRACLSVCPRASVSPKPHVRSSPRFSRTRLGRPLTTSVVCRRACVSLHSDSCCSVVYERANRRCLITPLDHNSTDTLLVPRPHTAYYKRRRCSGALCRIIIGGDTMRLSGQQELESDVCCRLQVAPSAESYGGNRRPGRK